MNDGLNYEAWARNAVAFIRERGLESEFSDWCGGWPVPVKATAPMIAAAPELLAMLIRYRTETPLGHQPHMIALEADKLIARARGEQA